MLQIQRKLQNNDHHFTQSFCAHLASKSLNICHSENICNKNQHMFFAYLAVLELNKTSEGAGSLDTVCTFHSSSIFVQTFNVMSSHCEFVPTFCTHFLLPLSNRFQPPPFNNVLSLSHSLCQARVCRFCFCSFRPCSVFLSRQNVTLTDWGVHCAVRTQILHTIQLLDAILQAVP